MLSFKSLKCAALFFLSCFWNRPNCLFLLRCDGWSSLAEQDGALTYVCCCTKLIFAVPSLRLMPLSTRSMHESHLGAQGHNPGPVLQRGENFENIPSPQSHCVFQTCCWEVALRGEILNLYLQVCVTTVLRKSWNRMIRRSITEKILDRVTFALKLIA